jgi:hypothetical protein
MAASFSSVFYARRGQKFQFVGFVFREDVDARRGGLGYFSVPIARICPDQVASTPEIV